MFLKQKEINKLFDNAEDSFIKIGEALTKNLSQFVKSGAYIEDMDNMFKNGQISLDDESRLLTEAYEHIGLVMSKLDELRVEVQDREEKERQYAEKQKGRNK